MADVFTQKKRSEVMSRVKSRGNAATELRLIEIFREHKITGWRRGARLFGNPDFVFAKAKVAVFVDGCFWHGCPRHGSLPRTNCAFWRAKLIRNKRRDRLVNKTLASKGWATVRIWQHQLRESRTVARRFRILASAETIATGSSAAR